jgi:hypothetical protein
MTPIFSRIWLMKTRQVLDLETMPVSLRRACDRIDDDDIDRAAANQDFADFQRLLAAVRLRDQEIFDIDPELARIIRIQRVFGVDESGGAAEFLGFGDGVQRKRGLAAGFRAEDFDNAAARKSADSESRIERQ